MPDHASRQFPHHAQTFAELFTNSLRDAASIWHDAKYAARVHGRSVFAVLEDVVRTRVTQGLKPHSYFRYRLYDPTLAPDEKRRYIDDRAMGAGLWSRLTPRRYGMLYHNKIVFNRFFAGLGFPVARLYGVYHPIGGRTADGQPLRTVEDLRRWLSGFEGDGFVFKAAEGLRGYGVMVLGGRAPSGPPDTFLSLSGEPYDAAGLAAATADVEGITAFNPDSDASSFLLEERLRPHPAIVDLAGGPTLCTVRLLTIIDRQGEPRIITGAFKLQPEPTGIDHMLHGAVGCQVDVDTGILGPGRIKGSHEPTSMIPRTQRSFVGFRLPDWAEVRKLTLQAAAAFPWARAIGWDVAMTDRGPALIEGNERWGTTLIQMTAPRGLMRGELLELCRSLPPVPRRSREGALSRIGRSTSRALRTTSEVWKRAKTSANGTGPSALEILRDVVTLRSRYGVSPDAYFEYRLFERHRSLHDKLGYVSQKAAAGGLWSLLTPEHYRALYDNKWMFNAFFRCLGLPVAEIFAVYDPEVGFTCDGGRLRTPGELESWMQRFGRDGFVFKPVEGGLGHQVVVLESRAPGARTVFRTPAGEEYDAERLVAATRDTGGLLARDPEAHVDAYLLQERVRPHPAVAELTGGPVLCTVRVQTILGRNGEPRVAASAFKLQTGPSGTDHFARGAIACSVDTATGRLGPGRIKGATTEVDRIPGTGRSFTGFALPCWNDITGVALGAAAGFPWARSIGWDIAVADRGPVLIEGNARWSPLLVQIAAPAGLRTGEFKAVCDELEGRQRARGRRENSRRARIRRARH